MNRNTAARGRYLPRRVRAGGARRNGIVSGLLSRLPRLPAVLVAAALLPACSAGSSPSKVEDAGGTSTGLTYDLTFTAVYNEILQGSCAVPFCHLGSVTPMALPDQASAYAALVNVPAASTSYCMGLTRVIPGDPAMSLLYQKIEQPSPGGLCGLPMPGSGRPPLDAKQIAQIKQWIMLGAKND